MKWLIDAQLPARLSVKLRESGQDCVHTSELPSGNRTTDAEINRLCMAEERILITKDADFIESFYLQRKPYKLLVISTGNISNASLERLVLPVIAEIAASFETARFVELTKNAWIIHE